MHVHVLSGVIALISASTAASGSSMVLGSGLARACFEAAELDRVSANAVATCDRALIEEPLHVDDRVATFVNRGILRARLADQDGALADYDRAIRLDPAQPEAYLNKAALFLKRGDWRTARGLFDAALERRTSRPEIAYFGRAVAAEVAGDLAGAYADYQKAAELAPRWDTPRKELARFSVRKRG